jgi:hypothetical protein
VVKMTSFGHDFGIKRIPNKIDRVPVKVMKADHMAKRLSGGTPPNCGR